MCNVNENDFEGLQNCQIRTAQAEIALNCYCVMFSFKSTIIQIHELSSWQLGVKYM